MMPVFRRVFGSRAVRIHGSVFLLGCCALAALDWAQGIDSSATVLGLDWAHILMLIWLPIFLVHAVSSWWGNEIVDQIDDETMVRIRGRWFGGYRE